MKFIEGCIRLVGPSHVRKILDNAGKRWLKATQAFCTFRMSKEVLCGGARYDDGDKLDRNCCSPSSKFDPTCALSRNWGLER